MPETNITSEVEPADAALRLGRFDDEAKETAASAGVFRKAPGTCHPEFAFIPEGSRRRVPALRINCESSGFERIVFVLYPGGITDISRGLSEATPPDSDAKKIVLHPGGMTDEAVWSEVGWTIQRGTDHSRVR